MHGDAGPAEHPQHAGVPDHAREAAHQQPTIGVVLNKVEDDIGIDISDVQEVLDNKIVSVLPYSREVMKSINKGKPALVSAANSDIGKKLAGGMGQFLGVR